MTTGGSAGERDSDMAKKGNGRTNLQGLDKDRLQGGVLDEVYEQYDRAIAEIHGPSKQNVITAMAALYARIPRQQRAAVTLLLCGGDTEKQVAELLAEVDRIVTQEIRDRLPRTAQLYQDVEGRTLAEERQQRAAKGLRARKAKEP